MLLFDTFNEFFVKQNNIKLHQLFDWSIINVFNSHV